MIRLALTPGEHREAAAAMVRYRPDDQRDFAVIRKIVAKLNGALSGRPVGFTDKEANVLMDALTESETDLAEHLSERLTGEGGVIVCEFCREEIANPRGAFRHVQGWEKERHQGGTNHVVLRETSDRYACIHCIDRLTRGIPAGQGSLL